MKLNGFDVYPLQTESIEAWCVPELGGKIIRLCDLRCGRDWLWHPGGPLQDRLWRNLSGAPFSESPMVGIDDCFPTVAPCISNGKQLSDHGDVWSASWNIRVFDPSENRLVLAAYSNEKMLGLTREIKLERDQLKLSYTITNKTPQTHSALWCLHPLLQIKPGDQFFGIQPGNALVDYVSGIPEIASGDEVSWPDIAPTCDIQKLNLGHGNACIKLFIEYPEQPLGIKGCDGESLTFCSSPSSRLTHMGIWLTRGGWEGYHHVAIEPTNAPHDRLDMAEQNHPESINWPPHSTSSFQVVIRCHQS